MLSDLKELRCLVEGKEENREREKNDVKEEYKDHKGFYKKWMNVGPPSDQGRFSVYLWLQPERYSRSCSLCISF